MYTLNVKCFYINIHAIAIQTLSIFLNRLLADISKLLKTVPIKYTFLVTLTVYQHSWDFLIYVFKILWNCVFHTVTNGLAELSIFDEYLCLGAHTKINVNVVVFNVDLLHLTMHWYQLAD